MLDRKLVKQVKEILKKDYRMSSKITNELEKLGFKYTEFGTSQRYHLCSKDVKILDVTNRQNFAKPGKYLVVGICNYARGSYSIYRGYALKLA